MRSINEKRETRRGRVLQYKYWVRPLFYETFSDFCHGPSTRIRRNVILALQYVSSRTSLDPGMLIAG